MRPVMFAFLILSPFIALAQNYDLHTPVDALTHAPVAHFARFVVADASIRVGCMVHAVSELLG